MASLSADSIAWHCCLQAAFQRNVSSTEGGKTDRTVDWSMLKPEDKQLVSQVLTISGYFLYPKANMLLAVQHAGGVGS